MEKQSKNYYWTKEVDSSILKFVKTENMDERNTLFNEKIYPALSKLVECIHNTFSFNYIDDSSKNIEADAITHLYLQLGKFKPGFKFKAFSYFSIICKNYFIQLNAKEYKKNKIHIPITETEDNGNEQEIPLNSIIPETNDRENRLLTIKQKRNLNKVIKYYKVNSCGNDVDRKLMDKIEALINAGNGIPEWNNGIGRYPIWMKLADGICRKGSIHNKIKKLFGKVGFNIIKERRKYVY